MKFLRSLLIGLAAWALTVAPVAAAITVADLGVAISASSVATITITTGANDCPVGSYVFVALAVGNSSAWTVSDGHSNTYAALNTTYTTNQKLVLISAKVTTDVSPSSSLQINWTTNSTPAAAAICVTGLLATTPLDKTGGGYDSVTAQTSITGTGSPLTTGALSVINEIVIGVWNTTATYGTWVEDANFTSDNFPTPGANHNVRIAHCVTNCSATTSVGYAPTWATNRIVGAQVWSFKPAAASSAAPKGTLLGVGP
jgi:hypothetical protein